MPKAIHYKHPRFSDRYHCCGMGDPLTIKITDDIDKVTCQRCLGTAAGQKASNRQIGDRPKPAIHLRLDADLREELQRRSHQQSVSQVSIVESALKLYFQAHPHQP